MASGHVRVIAVVACAAVVAGCANSATQSAGTSGPTTPSSSSPKPSPSFPPDLPSLALALQKGTRSLKTAHVLLLQTSPGSRVRLAGDEIVANGNVTAMRLVETANGESLQVVLVNDKVYLHSASAPSGKPWLVISRQTTNPTLKALYEAIAGARQTAGGDAAGLLALAARRFKRIGIERFEDAEVAHYELDVDPQGLPDSFAGKQALINAGVKALPVDMLVDRAGVARHVLENLRVQGQPVVVDLTISKVGAPIRITAPPASELRQPGS